MVPAGDWQHHFFKKHDVAYTLQFTSIIRHLRLLSPPRRLLFLCSLFVCLSAGLHKNYSTDLHKIRWKIGNGPM